MVVALVAVVAGFDGVSGTDMMEPPEGARGPEHNGCCFDFYPPRSLSFVFSRQRPLSPGHFLLQVLWFLLPRKVAGARARQAPRCGCLLGRPSLWLALTGRKQANVLKMRRNCRREAGCHFDCHSQASVVLTVSRGWGLGPSLCPGGGPLCVSRGGVWGL